MPISIKNGDCIINSNKEAIDIDMLFFMFVCIISMWNNKTTNDENFETENFIHGQSSKLYRFLNTYLLISLHLQKRIGDFCFFFFNIEYVMFIKLEGGEL